MATAPKPTTDQRSRDILDAARIAFSEKGFDGASMQDLARAAGMSVGNFYRYYPSKSAIVQALIFADIAHMEQSFSALSASADPLQSLRSELKNRVETGQANNEGQLWAEINAASRRNPDVAGPCAQMEATVAQYLLHLFAFLTGLPFPEVARRYGAHADFIVMMVRSAVMLRPRDTASLQGLNALILKSIDNILDDVALARVKG